MGFWVQLKLILWKNFITRKRQKVRGLVELVWPLFLFLILMWVRSRGLRTNIPECHFTEKALPSTGLLPFLQSFICTFNNTCHYSFNDSLVKTGDLSPESFLKLINELQEIFDIAESSTSLRSLPNTRQTLTETSKNFEKFSDTIQSILSRPQNLSDDSFVATLGDSLQSTETLYDEIRQGDLLFNQTILDQILKLKINLKKIQAVHLNLLGNKPKLVLCDPELLKDVLHTDEYKSIKSYLCSLSEEELLFVQGVFLKHWPLLFEKEEIDYFIKHDLAQNISWEDWFTLKRDYQNIQGSLSTIQHYTTVLENGTQPVNSSLNNYDKSKIQEAIILINNFFCGNSSDNIANNIFKFGGNATRFDSLQDQFRERTKIKFQYDNESLPACNALYKQIEENQALSVLWRIMKPFLVGKIVYTPVTPATRSIMDRVNSSFYIFSVLKSFGSNFPLGDAETAQQLQFLPKDDLHLIVEFLNNTQGKKLLYEVLHDNADKQVKVDDSFNTLYRLYNKVSSSLGNSSTDNSSMINQLLQCLEDNKIEAINDQGEAEMRGMDLIKFNKLWALIEFISPGEDSLDPLVTYKIRMNTERVDNTEFIQDILLRPGSRMRALIDLKYITYGFAYLQDMIDHAIIAEQTGRNDLPSSIFQQFPYPCYIDDEFIMAISRTFPLFMVLSWVYTCSMIVKAIVYEKEQRLKETMRVMGLGNGVHWIGWFIDSLIPMLFTIFLLTVILVYGNVLRNSDPLVVYLFLFCYCLATITQAFLMSVFFSKANLAAASAGIIFFVLYLPYPFLVRWMFYLSSTQKYFLSLSSNVAFGLGASYMALFEEKGTGIKWEYIDKSPYYDDDFSLVAVLYMLLIDSVIYFILAWYIETVFPGKFGIPKPWYFPLTYSYWSGKQPEKIFVSPGDEIFSENSHVNDNFESEPTTLKKGVLVQNLKKKYSSGKIAVNGISLNFYEGQITSFLGHNGAGKTTTISILTGLFPPSSGTALINGLDITKNIDRIRKNLGMCPQHNVLFHRLTVEEHLWFYGSLRSGSVNNEVLKSEIDQMIHDLGLPHKKKSLPSGLSGGMQRKLSIAVAFIGGSKVVILDEPTSGVDPFSRRSIWELLLKYKAGRTVILTTHYMDEADLLGDRIAIIANGNLMCCGSSIFLKNRFGSGYHLTIEVNSERKKVPPSMQFDLDGDITGIEDQTVVHLTKYIKKIVPSVIFVEHIGSEVSYVLPERDNSEALMKLCNALDEDKALLDISSYGISDTSLEEIFLKVAENDPAHFFENTYSNNNGTIKNLWRNVFGKEERTLQGENSANASRPQREVFVHMNGRSVKYSSVPIIDDLEKHERKSGNKFWRQFFALHSKRFHHTRRNRKALFSELILPAIFICMSLAVSSIFPTLQERPPLDVNPWLYRAPRYMFYSQDSPQNSWVDKYLLSMKGPEGVGTKCIIINETRNSECSEAVKYSFTSSSTSPSNYSTVKCSCESGAQICPHDIGEPAPPSVNLASAGDILYDLTGANISDWIVNTWPKYEANRYGGFSFGSPLVVPQLSIKDMIYNVYAIQQPGFLDYARSMDPAQINSSINTVKVWFNNKGWVSSVGYMNAINNVILRASIPSEKESLRGHYGIKTINHPMNFTSKQLNIELIRQGGVTLLHAISVIFALSFVPASFTLYLIEERESHSKHLQLVSGVNKVVYWLQAFTWDLAAYLLSALIVIFIFLAFNEQAYVSVANFPGTLLLLFFYGWACIPLMYPLSSLFRIPSSAFVGLSCANMFIGIITTVTTFVLAAFDDKELSAIDDILKEVFLVFPHFCLGDGLMKLATNHLATASLMNLDIEYEANVFEWDFLGKNILCMAFLGVFFFLITLAVEYDLLSKSLRQKVKNNKISDTDEFDVAEEKKRVADGQTSQDVLVIKELFKIYKSSRVPSVNNISVGVKPGECFGLLGLNGAGKTTTFKILTGAIKPTSGDATVLGYSVREDPNRTRKLMGYCPQFDALDPLLTPYEHLVLYARIRNVPSNLLQKRVDECLQRMGLGYYSSKLAKNLSGGNRRKLSTAIALIGNPPLVLLDEPTTGMDPKARRFLWTCIQDLVKSGSSVILTSHSMEECQALCTRLTIMVSGSFKCLGSSQHLKMKYGTGYRIVLRCKENNILQVKDQISIALPSVRLIEEHYSQLRYEVSDLRLSRVFEEMEKLKSSHLLLDYSISQTTLEEIFLRFANEESNEPWEKQKTSFMKKCINCCSGKG